MSTFNWTILIGRSCSRGFNVTMEFREQFKTPPWQCFPTTIQASLQWGDSAHGHVPHGLCYSSGCSTYVMKRFKLHVTMMPTRLIELSFNDAFNHACRKTVLLHMPWYRICDQRNVPGNLRRIGVKCEVSMAYLSLFRMGRGGIHERARAANESERLEKECSCIEQ